MIVNGLPHYTQWWVNRRSKKALKTKRIIKYNFHYLHSWKRYQKYLEDVAAAIFGVPVITGEKPSAVITIVGPTP